ncbi:tail fiber protein, partial [Salinivibrio costicola]
AGNTLTYVNEEGQRTNIDLSLYLDDTNAARISGGTVDSDGIATFVRDDSSSFEVDMSILLDDSNLSRIVSAAFNSSQGILTFTRNDNSTLSVDLDNRYLQSFEESDPTVPGHVKSITTSDLENWNAAHSWGNHADVGYLTSIDVPESGNWWKGFVRVNSGGIAEVGKYIDFHDTNDETDNYSIRLSASNSTLSASGIMRVDGGQRVFADNYHPNADKWTTARSISLTGNVTGSVTIDGSSNVSIYSTIQTKTSDGFTGTYSLVWKGANDLYVSNWLKVDGGNDRLIAPQFEANNSILVNGVQVVDANRVVTATSLTVSGKSGFGKYYAADKTLV